MLFVISIEAVLRFLSDKRNQNHLQIVKLLLLLPVVWRRGLKTRLEQLRCLVEHLHLARRWNCWMNLPWQLVIFSKGKEFTQKMYRGSNLSSFILFKRPNRQTASKAFSTSRQTSPVTSDAWNPSATYWVRVSKLSVLDLFARYALWLSPKMSFCSRKWTSRSLTHISASFPMQFVRLIGL